MSTLLRLLTIVRRLNTASKAITTRIHLSSLSTNLFNQSKSVYFLNRKNYVSSAVEQTSHDQVDQDSTIEKKMTDMNKKMHFHGHVSKFNIDEILSDIKNSGNLNTLQGLFLLRCCKEIIDNESTQSRNQLGIEIWNTLKDLNVPLDVSHYNALLSIYTENEHDFCPVQFLQEMVTDNVKPNRVTFQKIIFQLCSQGKTDEASEILNYLNEELIPVNEDMLSSFILGHILNDNTDAVTKTLDKMDSLNIPKTTRTYSAFMYGYARKGDIENIRKTIDDCNSKELWISDKVLLNIVYLLSVNGFPNHLDEILSLTAKGTAYTKEACKIIYKLIEKKQDEVAFKIFQNSPEKKKIGRLFVQTLVTLNRPAETNTELSDVMENKEIYENSFETSLITSSGDDMFESSINFIKAWKELGGLMREQYFYPILKVYGEAHYNEGVERILQKMIFEFEIQPSVYALKTYIIPFVHGEITQVFSLLLHSQVDIRIIANSVIMYLLSQNKIREAVTFMNNHYLPYDSGMIKFSLLQAFQNTEDASSFVTILHYLYRKQLDKTSYGNTDDNERSNAAQALVDSCISSAINTMPISNKYLVHMLFKNLVDRGVSLSPNVLEEIRLKLGTNITSEILNALDTLESGTLIPKPIVRKKFIEIKELTDIRKLESIAKLITITNSKAATTLKWRLFRYYCDTTNEKKVFEILEDLSKDGIAMTVLSYASIIDMYLNLRKIDDAETWLAKAKADDANVRLSQLIILKFSMLLAENGQLEKSLQYLNLPSQPSSFEFTYACGKLLNTVSKCNDKNLLEEFFDHLNKNNYITEFKHSLFSPFIDLHLSQGDGHEALQTFVRIYETYKVTPRTVHLMKKFISDGDETSLAKVKSICTNHFNENTTNFNIAMAYLENGRLDKAKSIMKNSCSFIHEEQVLHVAEMYYTFNKVDHLEDLFKILNDLKYDVEKLCVFLLKSYGMKNNWEKGYDLWIKMQEDDIKPSGAFMDYLNSVLKKKYIDENEPLEKFNEACRNNDYDSARQLLDSLPLVYKTDNYSMLCKKFAAKKQLSKVLNLWKDLNERFNLDLNLDTAAKILMQFLKENDIESIKKIENYSSLLFKKQLNYNYFLNKAYLQAGSWNVYLNSIKDKLNNGTLNKDNLNMDMKTAIDSLMRHPELCEEFESLAQKCSEESILVPMTALWVYYLLIKNPKSDEIYDKHIKNSLFHGRPNSWMEVSSFLYRNKDPEILLKLFQMVQQISSLKQVTKFTIYSKIINICLKLDHPKKYEYGLKCLECGLLDFYMEQFDIDTLVDLQTGLEKSGIPWPWSAKFYKDRPNDFQAIMKDC